MTEASGQIRGKALTGALSVLTAALLTPAAAFGSSGEITRALANANWTLGDIAATVSWSGCAGGAQPPACAWIPYMTIGPATTRAECGSPERDWPGLGEGIALVFGSGGFKGPGPFSYESPAVALRGGPEQLACLFALERSMGARGPHSLRLDAALLTAPPPPQAETAEPTAGEEPAASDEPPNEAPPESSEESPDPGEGQPDEGETEGEEPPNSPAVEGESPVGKEPPTLEEPVGAKEPEGQGEPAGPLVEEPSHLVDEPPQPPSSDITRAFASTERTRGSIAGSFTWDGCTAALGASNSYCAWIPYATIGPGTSRAECGSPERDWSSLGGDVSLVLWGGETIGAGTHEFDFPGIWLDGSTNQLLCLAAIEIIGASTYTHRLDSALLATPPMVSKARAVAEN